MKKQRVLEFTLIVKLLLYLDNLANMYTLVTDYTDKTSKYPVYILSLFLNHPKNTFKYISPTFRVPKVRIPL